MSKRNIIFCVVVAVIVLIGLSLEFSSSNKKAGLGNSSKGESLPQDIRDLSFIIGDDEIVLKDEVAEMPIAPDSAGERIVRYFGNEVDQDIDGDGDLDRVFLITDETGGSGTFFYAVGAIKEENGYVGSKAVLIGDRIAPQNIVAERDNLVVVNYAERNFGEPMSAPPSIGRSLWLKFDKETMSFGEVVQDFAGEAATNAPDKLNLIRVGSPKLGEKVGSPITVSGEARGYWFFEGSFPLIVTDWNGRIIGESYATADGEWMTEEFVPFTGQVSYELPADTPYKRGTLILRKDNPSGLPEHDDAVEMSIGLTD